MNLFRDHGLAKLINARGPSTVVGASRVSGQIIDYMTGVLPESVDMRQLQALASEVIGDFTGAEAGCVTGCAAAGVAVSVAALLTGDDLAKITTLPRFTMGRRRIAIQKAQLISGGGCSIEQLIRISGAEVVEVGESADCALFQLEDALDDTVAGALFVMGSRANTSGTIPLATFVQICHKRGVPVIVDAAGESDLRPYIEAGVDLLVVSSQKWLGGPTAALIAGREELVTACYLNGEFGIGRPMKAGKEAIAGLIGALETYRLRNGPERREREIRLIEQLQELLRDAEGLTVTMLASHEESISAAVLRIGVDPEVTGLAAWDLSQRLLYGLPRIAVDAYSSREGYVAVESALLDEADVATIASRILDELQTAKRSDARPSDYVPRFETLTAHMAGWRAELPVTTPKEA